MQHLILSSRERFRLKKTEFQFGIDVLLSDSQWRSKFAGKKWALVANPASVTSGMIHSLDALMATSGIEIVCALGPQHGMRGEKQYNMIESDDYVDPVHRIPIYSLYGKTRRPTPDMLKSVDGILIDLQDVGCRIYTYLTTMIYVMEVAAELGKSVFILDRPNPVGRKVEGSLLVAGQESFVGVGPVLMRHGLTLGELANYFLATFPERFQNGQLHLEVIPMNGYDPNQKPGSGWPIEERSWVNPSPNIPQLASARVYPGTVMLEGTNLSEGRGTTRPFECMGAPDIDGGLWLETMQKMTQKEGLDYWWKSVLPRAGYFEPTFYKHQGKLCGAVFFHVDHDQYQTLEFHPYRLTALAFKAIKKLHPDYALWRNFAYEYVTDRLPIDVITGGSFLRKWVEDPKATLQNLETFLLHDEKKWKGQIDDFKIYP